MEKINRYYDLTRDEKSGMNQADLERSILMEAAHRGIGIPIPLDEKFMQRCFAQYHLPAQATILYEIQSSPDSYSRKGSGIAFSTLEAAQKAMEGAISVCHETYPVSKHKICNPDFTVQAIGIGISTGESFTAKLEEFEQNLEPYKTLVKEIMEEIRAIGQENYDAEVRAAKRKEYLRLANGDEQIAAGFWAKIEKTEWPTS